MYINFFFHKIVRQDAENKQQLPTQKEMSSQPSTPSNLVPDAIPSSSLHQPNDQQMANPVQQEQNIPQENGQQNEVWQNQGNVEEVLALSHR